jgi:hypothetical protein
MAKNTVEEIKVQAEEKARYISWIIRDLETRLAEWRQRKEDEFWFSQQEEKAGLPW